jgi:hypothetical protein
MKSGYASSQPATYRIRVKGDLARWSGRFDGLVITPQANGETLLTGTVIDREALHRMLSKIRDLDLPLLHLQIAEITCPANE